MAKKEIIVSVDDAYLSRFPEVVEGVKKAGMDVKEAMQAVGVLSGAIDPKHEAALRSVEGVAHVQEQQTVQLAPPESPIQ